MAQLFGEAQNRLGIAPLEPAKRRVASSGRGAVSQAAAAAGDRKSRATTSGRKGTSPPGPSLSNCHAG